MDLSSQNNESNKISFLDDNDDFDFKPLSDGLGFHHEEKIKISINQTSIKPSHTKSIRTNPVLETREMNLLNANPASKSNYIQSDLALFYENKMTEIPLASDNEPDIQVEALKTTRLAAFLTDLFLISFVTYFTMSVVSKFTGIDFIQQLSLLEEMSIISVGFIFLSYYFIYFSLLEKMQGKTLGMDLFGIKLMGLNELSLINIFMYEVVVLLGFFSLGITNYMNLPQQISGIKLIVKK